MKHLHIITEYSRSINYGIGTYVNQLLSVLNNENMKLSVVCMHDKEHIKFEKDFVNNIQYFYLPFPVNNLNTNYEKWKYYYYRNVFYLLYPYFVKDDEMIFHFNFFDAYDLAQLLKKEFSNSKIVLTVHYMGWSFDLLGNVQILRDKLKNPDNQENKSVANSVKLEQKFINDCCDKVIAIAEHSYKTLIEEYLIPPQKLILIKHGIKDIYISHSCEERMRLRKKYFFREDDKILIFAGRLDPVKGVSILLQAFKDLYATDNSLRLIIAGDGEFKKCLKISSKLWSQITFTGFVNKRTLYELFTISDIGILPSLHEEFGYVALEMMMQRLPLIVSKTTGLNEIVDQDETGLKVFIGSNKNDFSLSVNNIKAAVYQLLSTPDSTKKMGRNGRKKFLKIYRSTAFKRDMISFYDLVQNDE